MADKEVQLSEDEIEYDHICRLYFDLYNFSRKEFKVSEEEIAEAYKNITRKFADGTRSVGSLNFNEYYNQCAFIRKYTSSVACMTRRATSEFLNNPSTLPVTGRLLQKNPLRIICIDGAKIDGMLGVCSALGSDPRYTAKSVRCHITDACSGWNDFVTKSFLMITTGYYGVNSDIFRRDGSTLTHCFTNLAKDKELNKTAKFAIKTADLVVSAKNLSIMSEPKYVTNTLKVTFNLMKPGAMFLGIDTGFNKNKYLREQAVYDGMELIYRQNYTCFYLPDLPNAAPEQRKEIWYETYVVRKRTNVHSRSV